MSKEWMKIGSDSTFNGGSFGCTAGYVIGSLTQVALTGYGYLSLNGVKSLRSYDAPPCWVLSERGSRNGM
jgi:hypothetical protein